MADQEQGDRSDRCDFATLWAENFSKLRTYVRIFVPSLNDSEDVLQETALAIAKDFEKYDPTRPFLEWAVGIARNRVLQHYRARRRDRRMVFNEEAIHLVEGAFIDTEPQFDSCHDALESCLRKLPRKSRQLIDLRYLSCLRAEEISDQAGLTVQSVYTRLSQIRKALLECIKRQLRLHGDSR